MTRRGRIAALVITVVMTVLSAAVYSAGNADDTLVLPVLMYHNIAEEYSDAAKDENITPERFREHMQGILQRGYTPILITDYYDFILRGEKLPENPIAITFDDGYLSNYEIAYPYFREHNMPATIFVVTSTVGLTPESGKVSTPHFSWEQAREMQQSGIIDIHSHSHTHRSMMSLTPAQLQMDLRLSKYLIERNLGKNCYIFSYPYGGYSEDTLRMAKYAGYRMQILVNDRESREDYLANRASDGIEHFTRLTVSGDMTVQDLYNRIDIAVKNSLSAE